MIFKYLVPDDSLTAGQALLDGQTLVSAQGIFTLGFFPNGDNTYLGIWYNNMKPRTVVWVANRDAPIKGGNGSLTLSTNSLDLLDRRGNIVWSRSRFSTNSPQAVSSTTLCHQGLQIHYGKVLLSPVTHCCLVWQLGMTHPLLSNTRNSYRGRAFRTRLLGATASGSTPDDVLLNCSCTTALLCCTGPVHGMVRGSVANLIWRQQISWPFFRPKASHPALYKA